MEIQIEFNPDITHSNISEYPDGKYKVIKIIPEGKIYFNGINKI